MRSMLVGKLQNVEDSLDAQLCAAATKVSDRESLLHFNRLLQQVTDINSKGPIFAKSILSIAIEALFITLVLPRNIALSNTCIFFKLTAIDQILVREANIIKALQHPSTKKVMQEIKAKYLLILSTYCSNTKISTFNPKDHAFIVAHHWFMKSLHAALDASVLKVKCSNLLTDKCQLSSKPIIICEDSSESASCLLLDNLKDRLRIAGYKTICLDHEHNLAPQQLLKFFEATKKGDGIFQYDSAIKAQHMKLKFTLENNFEVVMLDPCNNWHDKKTQTLLEMYTINNLGEKMSIAPRDLGLFYNSLHTLCEKDGKIVIVIDVTHAANLIANLQRQGIESIAVAPFSSHDSFEYNTTTNARIMKLFDQYNCHRLNLSNPDKAEELINEFWQTSLAEPQSHRHELTI